jgi:DNA helicase-2/ATP-dependent DNA helicase PcrA
VIENNAGRDRPRLRSGLTGAARLTTAALPTPRAEAEYVVRTIENLLGGTSHFALDSGRADAGTESGLSLADIAVLYRVHAQAAPLTEALDAAGLPFQQAGREPVRETDQLDFDAEKISLLTMHAAKGLEFKVVFITGLEEGLLPYQPPAKPPADVSEERRLFYVALTRAGERAYLTRCLNRSLYGRRRRPEASPFWREIEERLREEDGLPEGKPKAGGQMKLF